MGSRGRGLVAVSVVVFATVVLAAPAGAVTCTPTGTDVAIVVDNGESVTIARSGDAIAVNGAPCGTATVANTDTISVTSTGVPVEVTIDLAGGAFEPGATPEDDGGTSEIEFTVNLPTGTPTLRVSGSAEADHLVAGADGINLNANEATADTDVAITGTPSIILAGNDGDDVLGGATGGITLDGGEGSDDADYGGATQLTLADLSAGTVEHAGGGIDTLVSIENLLGSPGDDVIKGDAGPNVLDGQGGDDKIDGAGDADTLLGGEGVDIASFASGNKGVTVDLRQGTVSGGGTAGTTIFGFEGVTGTRKGDEIRGNGAPNQLNGGDGPDEIFGGGGADVLKGGNGFDVLFGQGGDDLLRGGAGKDQLDGGAGDDVCRGGEDPDAFVTCENL